jgi:probable HAF family extracellular repeat protein
MAYSINNNGQIVGWDADNIGHRRACLFDPTGNGNNIQLGDGEAAAINDNGQIVGYSNSHAFLFDSTGNGNNIDLNSLIDPACGWTLTNAFDINNNGWIVGQGIYRDINGFEIGDQRAFLLIIPEPATLILLSLGGLLLRKSRS